MNLTELKKKKKYLENIVPDLIRSDDDHCLVSDWEVSLTD